MYNGTKITEDPEGSEMINAVTHLSGSSHYNVLQILVYAFVTTNKPSNTAMTRS